jgi:hypothetical protein
MGLSVLMLMRGEASAPVLLRVRNRRRIARIARPWRLLASPKKTPQLLVTGWVVRSVHRLVVLPEELLVLPFGEVSQDHQRVGGVFRRLCGHAIQLTPACRGHPARRTGQDADAVGPGQAIRPDEPAPPLPSRSYRGLLPSG